MSIGVHCNKSEGGKSPTPYAAAISKYITRAKDEYGLVDVCAQIYVAGPRNSKITINDADINAIKLAGRSLVIHGAYIDNPWSLIPSSVINIRNEMVIAEKLGATGVIVHLAAGAFDDEKLKSVITSIGEVSDSVKQNVILWLEINTAKPSGVTYETPEKIGALFRRVDAAGPRGVRYGLCIDTAHLWACGVKLISRQDAEKWFADLAQVIPANTPLMMHLNDSDSAAGSGIDRHATLCRGNIWRDYHPISGRLPVEQSGIFAVLEWVVKHKPLCILERDGDAADDLRIISGLGFFKNE